MSSSVGTRLYLAVMDWRANNNVLGTGAHERGLRATGISVSEQGTGILVRGREGGTVRAAFIKQTEAEQIGKRALALRIAAGTLTGQAAGEAPTRSTRAISSTTSARCGQPVRTRCTRRGSSRRSRCTGLRSTVRG
ncbi:hypothetical protein SMC26_41000 [Actinomadura fulvescens]|uniref:Uncharacterized protein n=1 Tax=Actinomadura fulvescens TaxID=46160 RepID=A0ABP6DA11_9ACTN